MWIWFFWVLLPQRFCTFEAFHERKLKTVHPGLCPASLQASKSQLLLDAMAFLRKALRTAMFYQHIEMRKALTPLARFYLIRSYPVSAAARKDNPFDCFRIALCLSVFANVVYWGRERLYNETVAKLALFFTWSTQCIKLRFFFKCKNHVQQRNVSREYTAGCLVLLPFHTSCPGFLLGIRSMFLNGTPSNRNSLHLEALAENGKLSK